MICLVDTNVLLRFSRHSDPNYQIAQNAVNKLKIEGHQLQTTLQNFAEFWNVSTRPANQNGFGRMLSETELFLQELELLFPLLLDSPEVYPQWRRLVVKYNVSGRQVHDARLVATMIAHDVTHVLTFNVTDFERYASERIVAIDPVAV